MDAAGLQKLTLLDYPGKVACTVFTAGCNFRCPYCHNSLLVEHIPEDRISEEKLLAFLEKRKGILEGVAITGGEPTLHRELPSLLEKIKAMGFLTKLDTNGTNPEMLRRIVEAGLADRVAMDIKNAPEAYEVTVGTAVDMRAVETSKDYLLSGSVEYEFRTTVVKGLHTPELLEKAAVWIAGAKEYYLQQFKDSGCLLSPEGLGAFSEEEMRLMLDRIKNILPAAHLRGVSEE